MSISINTLLDNDTAKANNSVGAPFDGDSDSDMDWQESPHTPGTESEGSVIADEHATAAEEASHDASWASSTDDSSIEAAVARVAHGTLRPPPLKPSAARPIPVRSRCMRIDDIAPGNQDDSQDKDKHSSAFYLSLPSDRAPTPFHRESPHAPRVALLTPAPYPLASAPPNPFVPFVTNSIYPDETTPLFSPRNTNPFAARPTNSQPGNYSYGYHPLEPPISPPPCRYLRSPSPPRERVIINKNARGPPRGRFIPYPLASGNANENGSLPSTHASSSATVTREPSVQQFQLQKYANLLGDLLQDEVRNVTKTVLDLTSDLRDMRKDITSLRRDMERLKEEYEKAKAIHEASKGSVPMRPFSTPFYPGPYAKPPPTYNSSPRPFTDAVPDDWRARHLRTCEPIREHSAAGSQADEEPRHHWSMPRPQSAVGLSRIEQERDERNARNERNDRDSYASPSLARMMHDETYNDDRRSETLPPYTYRHDGSPRRSLHPIVGSNGRDDDVLSSQIYNY